MVKFLKTDLSTSQDLSEEALDYTTTYTKPFRLQQIIIRASVNITEEITITLDSGQGDEYNVVLRKKSLSGEQNFVYKPEGEPEYQANDNIRIQCSDTFGTGTVYVLVKASELN